MAEGSTGRSFGDNMLSPSPNHGTQRLPNDDDDENHVHPLFHVSTRFACILC